MVVLDLLALVFGLAGIAVAVSALVVSRRSRTQAERSHSESMEALSRSTVAGELATRAHAEASDAANRSASAAQAAESARHQAAEALTRASTAASLARRIDDASRLEGHPLVLGEVRWESEQIRPGRWVLKNAGSAPARAALVTDATRPPKFVTAEEVIPRDVQPGDHLQFRVATARDAPPPRVRVTWAEPGVQERRSYELTLILH